MMQAQTLTPSEKIRRAAKAYKSSKIGSDNDIYQKWQPLPGPQTDALNSDAYELFYGGAAGGGKTDLLLGTASTQHYQSIIFRRVFPSLRGIVERSREIYNPDNVEHGKDSYNESLHIWRLSSGRMIELGAIQHDKDKLNYKGRPHDFYGFDELPEFTESQYRFVTGWARSTRPGQRVRIMANGNPPTNTDGEWIIRRWAAWLDPQHPNPAKPGELRWYVTVDGDEVERENGASFDWKGETLTPKSRTFIPARLSDNPYLANTDYGATLQSLPEPLRSQLLYGDFSLSVADDIWQCIPTAWVQADQQRWVESERPALDLRSVGVDVARGGADKNVIAKLYGNYFETLISYPGSSTPNGDQLADLVKREVDTTTPIAIDVIGVGSSPYDTLRREGYRVTGINNGAGDDATDKTRRYGFANVRAASYWRLREALDPLSGEDIALPPDRELLADLCSARYKVTGARYALESKDDIKARIGRSPDKGDAVVMAWYLTLSNRQFGGIHV